MSEAGAASEAGAPADPAALGAPPLAARWKPAGQAFLIAALWYGAGAWLDARDAAWHATLVEVPMTLEPEAEKIVTTGKVRYKKVESVSYRLRYRYRYEGKDYAGEDEVSWNPQYQAAFHRTCRVDPADPATSTLGKHEAFWQWIGLVLAGLTGARGLALLFGFETEEDD